MQHRGQGIRVRCKADIHEGEAEVKEDEGEVRAAAQLLGNVPAGRESTVAYTSSELCPLWDAPSISKRRLLGESEIFRGRIADNDSCC